jgi:cell division protein FtsL
MYKIFIYLSLLIIIIISITIISVSLRVIEHFTDKQTLDERVTILENKINNTDKKMSLDGKLSIIDNNIEIAKKKIDDFYKYDKDNYSKMYLWYAELTNTDPEFVKQSKLNK